VAAKFAERVRGPVDTGVTLAVQVETPGVAVARTHAPKTSPATVLPRAIGPLGLKVWYAPVSVTVTETEAGVPTLTGDGMTVSAIVVGRGLTVSDADPALAEWTVVAVNDAPRFRAPALRAVNVAEHEATPGVAVAESVQPAIE
jgi:hypothetical protein